MLFANTARRHRWYVQITRATVNTGRVQWRLKLNRCSRAVLSGHEHGHLNASSVHRAKDKTVTDSIITGQIMQVIQSTECTVSMMAQLDNEPVLHASNAIC